MLDLVTTSDIAEMINRPHRTVRKWAQLRPEQLPQPVGTVGRYNVYLRSDVTAWVKERQQKELA